MLQKWYSLKKKVDLIKKKKKNPPASEGDMGSIPGLRRSHMPQSN